MTESPYISVIVVSLNGEKVIRDCLRALLASGGKKGSGTFSQPEPHGAYHRPTEAKRFLTPFFQPRFEAIVVNNGSTDATPKIVGEEFPSVRLINLEQNAGFAGGNNAGLRAAKGDILMLLNDDTIVRPDMLGAVAAAFGDDPKIGIVGCKILFPDGKTIQHAGGFIEPNGLTKHFGYEEEDRGQYDERRDVEYVTGAALAIRRATLEEIGLLDPGYFPIYFEEVEWCVRARKAGWRCVYEPRATLLHLESQTQGRYSPRFHYRYAKGRWRFILRNFSGREILRAIKHEIRWWRHLTAKEYLGPLAKAYAVTILKAVGIWMGRKKKGG